MSGVVRYGQAWVGNGYQIEAHPEGEWVRYADHAAEVARLEGFLTIHRDTIDRLLVASSADTRELLAANARAEAAEAKVAGVKALIVVWEVAEATKCDPNDPFAERHAGYEAALRDVIGDVQQAVGAENCHAQLAEVVGRGEGS